MSAPGSKFLTRLAVAVSVLLFCGCVKVRPRPAAPQSPASRNMLSPEWRARAAAARTSPPRPRPPTPPPKPAPEPPAAPRLSSDTAYALQLALDNAGFSPGGLDGRWGSKSRAALAAWQEANGRDPDGEPDDSVLQALASDEAVANLWKWVSIETADRDALRPTPASWLERAALDSQGYGTLQEALAERYHLHETAIAALNPDLPWPNPPVGSRVRVPRIAPRPIRNVDRLEILVERRLLRARDANGKLVAQFPCSIAANRSKRPVGQTLHIRACARNPEYTFDPELFADDPNAAGIHKKLRISPGPNNPVGLAWMGLDLPGYGIHGTPVPEKISRTESHGCFRLTNWDALRLLDAIRGGIPVAILP